MAATSPKKQTFARKNKKQYKMVQFESSIFEGTFELPSLDQIPNGIPRSMAADGDMAGKLPKWLSDAGVSEEAQDAIGSLDGEEFGTFLDEWGKASNIDLGK